MFDVLMCCVIIFSKIIRRAIDLLKSNKIRIRSNPSQEDIQRKIIARKHIWMNLILEVFSLIFMKISLQSIFTRLYETIILFFYIFQLMDYLNVHSNIYSINAHIIMDEIHLCNFLIVTKPYFISLLFVYGIGFVSFFYTKYVAPDTPLFK